MLNKLLNKASQGLRKIITIQSPKVDQMERNNSNQGGKLNMKVKKKPK